MSKPNQPTKKKSPTAWGWIINGGDPSAKSQGWQWKAHRPSIQLQPSVATRKLGPSIVRVTDFFSRGARNPDFDVKI